MNSAAAVTIVTNCTNRKAISDPGSVCVRNIAKMISHDPCSLWTNKLSAAQHRVPVLWLYKGRSFKLAREAAIFASARLLVVSAGLGLVAAETEVPSYAGTIVTGVPDSLVDVFKVAPYHWWEQLMAISPFSLRQFPQDGLVLLSLSSSYLAMVTEDLSRLDPAQLRIFTRANSEIVPASIRGAIMPYDERLDGPDSPLPGTVSDFAQRALFHFVTTLLPNAPEGSANTHADMVAGLLRGFRKPSRRINLKLEDREVLEIMRVHSYRAPNAAAMLRLLRDDLGVACEQTRFRRLFAELRQERDAQCLPL